MTAPTWPLAPVRCDAPDHTLCPDVERDEMHCPPRCDDYDGLQREACRRLGIDPDDTEARYGTAYEYIIDATIAMQDAATTCAPARGRCGR